MNIVFPDIFRPLVAPARYKGVWGGRGSGKSHFFGGLLCLRALKQRTRAVCLREVQNSIRDSVKQLLEDKIDAYGLSGYFEITDTQVRGPNDSLFVFRGLKNHNAASIKSLEGFDIAWVEEAQTVSRKSLDLLIPTIRMPGSELWFSWFQLFFVVPLGVWFAAVVADSIFHFTWNVAALPPPLDTWAGWIISALFLVDGGKALIGRIRK